jgi:undecaprenyl-diphosphatase
MVGLLLAIAFVQIVVESLPISSSGHVMLVERLFSFFSGHAVTVSRAYEYLLHGPTLVMLAIYFWKRWWLLVTHGWQLRFLILRAGLLVVCADGISTPVYLLIRHCHMLCVPLGIGFLITAGMLASLYWHPPRLCYASLSIKHACAIGFVQGIAGLSGVSRLASTYVLGVWMGLSERTSFYFSCMIQWPFIAVGFFGGLWEARSEASIFAFMMQWWFLLFVICSTILSFFVLRFVEHQMEAGKIWRLGIYLLFLGIFTLVLDGFLLLHAFSCLLP